MFYSQDRNQIRDFFRTSWEKVISKQPVEPLEALVGEVVGMHPEYHPVLESKDDDMNRDYQPEDGQTNPFLHMGMHITLREQFASNHPEGIKSIYKKILNKSGDPHKTEHLMMDCLAESLWQAQRTNQLPDDQTYIQCLQQIINQF